MTFKDTLPRQKDPDLETFDTDRSEESMKRVLRNLNLKVTTQRLALLRALQKGARHVTAQELYEKVHRTHPEVGFATVYRFLRTLDDGGFVTETRVGSQPSRYELTPKHHHDHLSCTSCGKICEFENKTIEKLQEKVAEHFGFVLTNHVLELFGLCPDCQNK